MSFAGIQTTVNLYTMQQADLTNRLSDIMHDITRASSQSTELLENVNAQKNDVKNSYASDSQEYKDKMEEIEDNYELELATINNWETELEAEKAQLETEVQAVTSYKESFTSALKQNVQKDFKYAQN